MKLRTLALALSSAGLFSACGGSGDASEPTTQQPPAPASVTVSGVAATGAALAGAAVSATCASGSGSATTDAQGAYSLTITDGALPCVLQATSSDQAVSLRSVATAGSGSSAVSNITPLTELVVAQIAGEDPAALLTHLDASQLAATFTPAAVSAAQGAVVTTLAAAGLDTSALGDIVSGTLVAASAGGSGNAYDQALDALATTLESAGTTLAALTSTVAAGASSSGLSGGSSGSSNGDALALPSDLLLKPKAPNCASLASGTYRIVKVAPSLSGGASDTVTAIETATLDAPTLTFTSTTNPDDHWTWVANGNCRYSSDDGAEIVVSPAGVVVARAVIGSDDDTVGAPARGSARLAIALPVQTVALADLAGSWNLLGWQNTGNAWGVDQATFTLGADGKMSAVKCDGDTLATPAASCATSTALLPAFSVNGEGGFTIASTDPSDAWSERAFAYRAGNGELLVLGLSASGEFFVATRVRTLALPAVGEVSGSWNLQLNAGNVAADALSTSVNTVTAVDATAGSYARANASNGSSITVPQTVELNSGRNGYWHRAAASVTDSAGNAATVREGWFLPLKGFGLTAYYVSNTSTGTNSNARFGISVKQP